MSSRGKGGSSGSGGGSGTGGRSGGGSGTGGSSGGASGGGSGGAGAAGGSGGGSGKGGTAAPYELPVDHRETAETPDKPVNGCVVNLHLYEVDQPKILTRTVVRIRIRHGLLRFDTILQFRQFHPESVRRLIQEIVTFPMLPPRPLSQEEAAGMMVSQFVNPRSHFNALGSIKLFVPFIPEHLPTVEFEVDSVDPEGLGKRKIGS